MKYSIVINLIVFLFLAQQSFSQVGKICNWENNKKACAVITFDDCSAGQFPLAVPELKKRNFQATFFPIANYLSVEWSAFKWPMMQATAAYGNEIANHTNDHSDQATAQPAAIDSGKNVIQYYIPSQEVCTFAYPNGTVSQSAIDYLKTHGYIGSRGVMPSSWNYKYDFVNKIDDYYTINTYTMNNAITLPGFTTELDNFVKGGGLLTLMYHSVNSPEVVDVSFSPVTVSALQQHLDALVSYQDRIWITTFAKALKYHHEKNCATLTQVAAPDGLTWKLNLSDTLANNSLYNQPLSIIVKMNGIVYDKITQNGTVISIDSVFNDTIMFKAVPDGGTIELAASNGMFLTASLTPTIVKYAETSVIKFSATALSSPSHNISEVSLDLSSIGGSSKVSMNASANNTYEYSYTLNAGTVSGDMTIIVKAIDNVGNSKSITLGLDVSAGIDISSASVSPAVVANTSSQNLSFMLNATDDGSVSSVTLDLSAIGGGNAVLMNAIGSNNYELNYSIAPQLPFIGIKTITATVTDNLGNKKMKSIVLTVNPTYKYMEIYTDNSTMICSSCFWTTGTFKEQTNAGAIEGVKDYLFDYSGTWAAVNLNLCEFYLPEKDFSAYDSIEISYKGPTTGVDLLFYLFAKGDIKSKGITLPKSVDYTTVKLGINQFKGVDLTQIIAIHFETTTIVASVGSIRIDNIKLLKLSTDITTDLKYINEVPSINQIAYPNPFNDNFNFIVTSKDNYKMIIKITNILGKVMFESNSFKTNENIELGNDLLPGIYFIESVVNGHKQIIKICKD